jgi:hypothetical protein
MTQQHDGEVGEIIIGMLILFGINILVALLIFLLGLGIGQYFGSYSFLNVWLIGLQGLFLWQLLYVIPLVIRYRRQQKFARMKGVIIAAVVTALLNGACYLWLLRPF